MSCLLCNSTGAELELVEVCVSAGDDAVDITGAELALVKLGLSACNDTPGFETLAPPFETELERFCRMDRALTAFAGTKDDSDQLTSLITSK